MEVMNAPAGFYIRSVTRDGAGIKPGSQGILPDGTGREIPVCAGI